MEDKKERKNFKFNIYKKENGIKTEDFNIKVRRVYLSSAVNYVNNKYKDYCIERI